MAPTELPWYLLFVPSWRDCLSVPFGEHHPVITVFESLASGEKVQKARTSTTEHAHRPPPANDAPYSPGPAIQMGNPPRPPGLF